MLQQLVADAVAQRIVDVFESIQIDEQHADAPAVAFGLRDCLAQTPATGAEYLVYAPSGGSFRVDLTAMPKDRKLAVEWFNPSTGAVIVKDPVHSGSSQRFTPPFNGDAVLYLVDTAGHAN